MALANLQYCQGGSRRKCSSRKKRGLRFFMLRCLHDRSNITRNGGMAIKIKLPEIERKADGSLPRMTPAHRKRANALIRKACCNCDNGNCLLLDDGEPCVCPQSISYSVCCKWFRWAVLPGDPALEAEIFQGDAVKHCSECGQAFVSKSKRAKYCPDCAEKVHRRQKTESERKRRSNVDK